MTFLFVFWFFLFFQSSQFFHSVEFSVIPEPQSSASREDGTPVVADTNAPPILLLTLGNFLSLSPPILLLSWTC